MTRGANMDNGQKNNTRLFYIYSPLDVDSLIEKIKNL
jgi:hypothetical protein